MIRAYVSIHGRVQNVFFRAHTQEKAWDLGVFGWVANEADGTVTLVVEGPANKVNALIDWCHSGPTGSTVDRVDVDKSHFTGEFHDFNIRH